MAEPNRLAAALSYEQDRPAFGNPNMLEQGRKMRERKQAEQIELSAQNVKNDLLARALMRRYNPETPPGLSDTGPQTGLTDTQGPQTLDEAVGLDPRVDRSMLLPYSQKEGFHVPAFVADVMKLATASNPQYSNLMQPEEAMPLATNLMGGGMAIGKAPAGSLGMNVTSKGRIPETGVDTRKLADMLERAGVKGGYEIAREGSAVSPSQYITFINPADELATRQVRISNHADKYPELASGVRTSVDPATEVSFEQAVNWLAKEGYPTSLSKKYKNIPSWEQHYFQQQAARDANKLQGLIDAWRNKPKATRGPIPTEYDLLVKENK